MVVKKIILMLISLGGGITVGSATAAFLTILQIVPRLCQITETKKHITLYEKVITLSFILSIIIYFSELNFGLPKYSVVIFGLIYGTFVGLLSSALAEVLNVIPILSKKLKIKERLTYMVWALLGGKVAGALCFWLYLNKMRWVNGKYE